MKDCVRQALAAVTKVQLGTPPSPSQFLGSSAGCDHNSSSFYCTPGQAAGGGSCH